MNPQERFCPDSTCAASREPGMIGIHSRKDKRYRCKVCEKTFSQTTHTAMYGLKKAAGLFSIVVMLLAHGCPVQAVVAAYGLDERTVRVWLKRAGEHCQNVHEQLVSTATLDLQQIQVDELKVKTQRGIVWMALVMMVSTRLWLGGAVHASRGKDLLFSALDYARRWALCRPLLIAVDGFNIYIKTIQQTFGTLVHVGQRHWRWLPWPDVAIVQVMNQRRGGQRGHFRRQIVQGCPRLIARLIRQTQGKGGINTAFIERLNATVRQRLACLARHSRATVRYTTTLSHSMFLVGCVYNLCTYHRSLALPLHITTRRRRWIHRTPAIAAGLTDHRWSAAELMSLPAAPSNYQRPKRPKKSQIQPILWRTT